MVTCRERVTAFVRRAAGLECQWLAEQSRVFRAFQRVDVLEDDRARGVEVLDAPAPVHTDEHPGRVDRVLFGVRSGDPVAHGRQTAALEDGRDVLGEALLR